jgi:D-alanyl-D-alanine-carboxypeptidase/D-alanyl-D-alanine-endopeptidase
LQQILKISKKSQRDTKYRAGVKSIACLTVAICSIMPPSLFGQHTQSALDATIRKLGDRFIVDKQAVGLSIGVYANGDGHFYNFGSIERDKDILPSQNTVYEIGSITKTFVSLILAIAVQEQKANLDDDIRKYLKESYPNLEYNGIPIKLVHLANTTSLLPDWLPELPVEIRNLSNDSSSFLRINYYNKLTSTDFFKALHSVKLDTIPGTRSAHSNAAAQLLAYILEGIYQMPMEKLITKYVTTPYKMNETFFINEKKLRSTATGYTASGNEANYEFAIPYFKNVAGLGSTASDLVKYIKMYLDTTNETASLCLRKTIDMTASSGKVTKMRPDHTATPDVYSAALGWFKYHPSVSNSQIWADGGTNGFNSYVVIYPHLNSGVVVLANKSDEKIFRALPAIAYEISKVLDER